MGFTDRIMRSFFRLLFTFGICCPSAQAAVLWMDNFNTTNSTNFDASPLAGRLSGSEAGSAYLRSYGAQQQISNNQLLLPAGDNGVRWEIATNAPTSGAADRFDWAAGSAGG